MQAVVTDWKPRNIITTPLEGVPTFINSGIIKAVMTSGEKVSVGQIDYQEFDEENFQYVITPYWDIIDILPANVFQGIPGIKMELRLKHYYRANYIPTFIAERTPSENREDLWELLEAVGLDYYDRFEWLLRTNMRAANDNLIVERRRQEKQIQNYTQQSIATLQYGDTVIIDRIESIATTSARLSEIIFKLVANGIDVVGQDGRQIIDSTARQAMLQVMLVQRSMEQREHAKKRRQGIETAKQEGKYQGRKPIEVDENTLRQVAKELDSGIINVAEAMKRTGIASRSTFYRKLKQLKK